MMFDIVKKFYDNGLYSKKDVEKFVVIGKITEEQYEDITGETYHS